MKLDITSNISMYSLIKHLEDYNIIVEEVSPFDQVIQELENYVPEYHNNVLFLHVDGECLLKDTSYCVEDPVSDWWEPGHLLAAIEDSLKRNPNNLHIVSSIVFSPYRLLPYTERNGKNSLTYLEYHINRDLETLCTEYENLVVLDMYHLFMQHGWDALTDNGLWYAGRFRFNSFGLSIIATHINNIINGWNGKLKKCLVLDCDNTLWGGICGEEKIQISEDGRGKIYRDFQRMIKGLQEAGVILTLCSKNNKEDVVNVFENNKNMVLEFKDFVIRKINWENKAKNIKEIAEQLNIGLDSIVFIDDSVFERELVKSKLKEVTVPDMPTMIEYLPSWFLKDVVWPYFPKLEVTSSDLDKTNSYKRKLQREEETSDSSIKDYIEGLGIELALSCNKKTTFSRVAELSQKTNQFRMTEKAWTVAQLEQMANDSYLIFAIDYKDRFGYEGIIGGMVVCCVEEEFFIDNMFLSCRVLGRDVEKEFFNRVSAYLRSLYMGNIYLYARYTSSGKNKIAKEFYKECGMTYNNNIYLWEKEL